MSDFESPVSRAELGLEILHDGHAGHELVMADYDLLIDLMNGYKDILEDIEADMIDQLPTYGNA